MPARLLATAAALAALPAFAQEPPPPAAPAAQPIAPPANRNTVAVVIGLSSYANLPDAVELDFARSDAAKVAQMFRHDLRFSHVFLLGDGEATRDAIRDTLRTEVAQLIGPDDLFIFYFAGHGIGADLGLPTFLAYDSTLENGQEDGLVLDAFARDLSTWIGDGVGVIVTDAIHRNQLDGIYFFGPSADQWPAMPPNTTIISSSEALEPATDGAFGEVFVTALKGAADFNDDTFVTVAEMFRYVHDELGPTGQIPVLAGNPGESVVIATGVDRGRFVTADPDADTEEPEDLYPDVDIDKAKFVFLEGQAQTVQCSGAAKRSCAPSCYVWDFKGGRCQVGAVIDGFPMEGEVVVLSRGRYQCRRQGPNLVCAGPD